ncbi:unnamed protein product [Closterium sp. Naga37s-1]|nr:unnamed protein product [Closterium sp. Naga37s-1]
MAAFSPFRSGAHLQFNENARSGQCTLLGSLAGITVRNWDIAILPTFLGGECNPPASTADDPHFRGADGTQYDFNGLLDRSFCLVSDRRIHINMAIKGYQPIANLPGTATSLDEESLAAAVEAAANEKKPRHIRQLEQERLSVEELSKLEKMRANGSLPLTAEVEAALDRETGRRSGEEGSRGEGEEKEQHSIQYAKHELKARLLKQKPIRSWIRELQVMWRDSTGTQHSAFFKARDGKEQGRGSSGFINRLELDGSPVAPPLSEGSFIVGSGGFKLLLAETKSCKGKDEDEFHLTIDGVVDMGISARLAHPLMQTAKEAQAHFNVHIARLNVSNLLIVRSVLAVLCRAAHERHSRPAGSDLLSRGIPQGALAAVPPADPPAARASGGGE